MKCHIHQRRSRRFYPVAENLESRLAPAWMVDAATVQFHDVDGDLATVQFSVPVLTAANVNTVFDFNVSNVHTGLPQPNQQLQALNLTALGVNNLEVRITAEVRPGGDGQVNVGFLNAAGLDVAFVRVEGDLGRIEAGNADITTRGLGEMRVNSLGVLGTTTQNPGGTLETNVLGRLGVFRVDGNMSDARVTVTGGSAGRIGEILVQGNILDTPGFGLPRIYADGNMGTISIGGSVQAGQIEAGGNIAGVSVGGSLLGGSSVDSGVIRCGGAMGDVDIAGNIVGTPADGTGVVGAVGAVGRVTIGGSIIGSVGEGSGRIESGANMGRVRIRQHLAGGTGDNSGIVNVGGDLAGIRIDGDLTGGAGNYSGTVQVDENLGPVIIGGHIAGVADHSGSIMADDIASLIVGGSLLGGTGPHSGLISSNGVLGPVNIGLDVIGLNAIHSGVITALVGIGDITIGGSLVGGTPESTGQVITPGSIGQVRILAHLQGGGGASSGIVSAGGTIAGVKVGGDLMGGDGLGSGRVHAEGSLGRVKVGGWLAGGTGPHSGRIESMGGDIERVKIGYRAGGGILGNTGDFSGAIVTSVVGMGDIGTVRVTGDIVGGAGMSSGVVAAAGNLGRVFISGSIHGANGLRSGTIGAAGRVASVEISGSVTSGLGGGSGSIRASDDLGPVVIHGDIVGNGVNPVIISGRGRETPGTTDIAIASVTIDGNVLFARILGGYDYGGATVNADAQIGSIVVGGNWTASSVVVGVAAVDAYFGNGDDARIAGGSADILAKISSIKIKGDVAGTAFLLDSFAFEAEKVGFLKIGGEVIPLTAGAHSAADNFFLALAPDVRLREF